MSYLIEKFKIMFSPFIGLPKEIYFIFVSRIINALGAFIWPLLTIIMTDSIGLSKAKTGEVLSIAGLVFILPTLIGGKVADSLGRKKVIIISEGLSCILYLSCAFVEPSMLMLALIIGAGAGMMMAEPAHEALIADLTTHKNRDSAYALSYMGWNLGFALGPAVGGILYKANHLKLLFLGDGLTILGGTLLILFFIKETLHRKTRNEEIDNKYEKTEKASIIKIMRKRPILIIFPAAISLFSFAYAQWGYLMPLHLLELFSKSGAQHYGILASFNGIVVVIFTPILTKMFTARSPFTKIIIGGITYAIGFGMLGYYFKLPAFFISTFIFTIGEILLVISCMPFIMNRTPASHRGRMGAIAPLLMWSGYFFGPVIVGKSLNWYSIELNWIFIGILSLIACILILLISWYDKKTKLPEEEDNEDTQELKKSPKRE